MRLLKLLITACFLYIHQGYFIADAQYIQNPDKSDKTVKIGLLIPENKSLAAKRGAELAIIKANENGGLNGKPFQLVVRSMEGPWGTGSKEAVSLIFDENVCALIGSPDGRNAHLVEQVTAKTRIVFLSTWSSDPTLAQAFVPWFFSCAPNALQQADALIDEIYNKEKIAGIAAVSDNTYDSKLALKSFVKRTKSAGKTDPVQIFYDSTYQDFNKITDQINKAGIRGIVLFGKPSVFKKLIQLLAQKKMTQALFGELSLLDDDDSPEHNLKYYQNIILVSSINLSGPQGVSFCKKFQKSYGRLPGEVAAYSYDGMNILINAIRKAGTDRIEIQKALTKLKYEGVTGAIQFDDKGKRMGTPGLMEIKNGIPADIGIRDNPGKN
jgi:branched-chain amino acid transport system substrate-binding protein